MAFVSCVFVGVWMCIHCVLCVVCGALRVVSCVGVRVVLDVYCLWWVSATVERSVCEGWVLQFVPCILVGV